MCALLSISDVHHKSISESFAMRRLSDRCGSFTCYNNHQVENLPGAHISSPLDLQIPSDLQSLCRVSKEFSAKTSTPAPYRDIILKSRWKWDALLIASHEQQRFFLRPRYLPSSLRPHEQQKFTIRPRYPHSSL